MPKAGPCQKQFQADMTGGIELGKPLHAADQRNQLLCLLACNYAHRSCSRGQEPWNSTMFTLRKGRYSLGKMDAHTQSLFLLLISLQSLRQTGSRLSQPHSSDAGCPIYWELFQHCGCPSCTGCAMPPARPAEEAFSISFNILSPSPGHLSVGNLPCWRSCHHCALELSPQGARPPKP